MGKAGMKDEVNKEFIASLGPGMALLNLSLWQSVDHLRHFLYRTGHMPYLRRKREWFYEDNGDLPPLAPATAPHHVLWWRQAGDEPPDFNEAMSKCRHLVEHGPTRDAFTITRPFPPPGSQSVSVADDTCSNNNAKGEKSTKGLSSLTKAALLSSILIGMVALRMGKRDSI